MRQRNKNGTFAPENKITEQPQLCKCGCGKYTTVYRKKARKYITGHNSYIDNPFKGKKHKPETLETFSKLKIGKKPWNYDKINSYCSIHRWIKRNKGKATICEKCGGNLYVGWANKSREYKQEIDDWLSLCITCHHKYDTGHKGAMRRIYG